LTVFDSALVRQLNFIKNAYANLIQFPNPLTAAASATAATSPILTDFVVMRTGDPTADVFVHGLPSSAPGLSDRPEIRMGTTKFISSSASGGSGGSGPTAVQIRQEMDANSKLATVATQTARVDALIENSGGDRFKAKALETAPSGSGGSGLTAEQVWTHTTRSLTDKAGFSLSTAGVQAIWDNTTRTLSSFGTLSGDTATAVWATTTRSLTTFGTLTADIWAVATRTITARPPSTASDTDLAAVKAKTDSIVITSGRVESVIDATLLAKEETVQAIPNAEENASAVRTNLTTELGRLDANVSSRSNHTADSVWAVATRSLTDKAGFSLSAAGVQAVWEYATRTLTTFGSLAADVWTATTRTITARPPNTASDTDVAAIKAKTDVIVVTSGRVAASIDDSLLAKQATVETVSTHTARVNALIENNGGDRFTPKALEAAPSGEGGGSGLTAEQIWTHEPRTITARPPGTASDTDVAAIKAKTDNLPASPASTADVQVQVTVDGGFTTDDRTALEAIPSADENADAVRAELAVELGRINATIGSRATPDGCAR
jgi:hypothetical protein